MPHPQKLSREMRDCIQHCLDCHAICVETAAHCIALGGDYAEPEHLRTLMDCAQICATSADFMLRGSPQHFRTCDVCSDLCRQCMESCQRMAAGDQTMTRCADICRVCADSCERMSQVTV